jgi:hypothetical protein
MLSKAPQQQKPMEQQEASPFNQDKLNDQESMDQEIASAALFEGLLNEQSLNAVGKALGSPEPAKALALLIFNVIEPAQVASMDTDTPLSPRVWLARGGAVDEFLDELADLGDMFGMEDEDILDMAPAIKQEVAGILQQRGSDLQAQGAQAQQAQAQSAPQAPAPQAPMGVA